MSITILNTSTKSQNAGDQIIVESILSAFPELLSMDSVPTHTFNSLPSALNLWRSDLLFLTGTNILGSKLWPPSPWRFGPLEMAVTRNKVIGVGLGWRQYEGALTRSQSFNYKGMFYSGVPVSTRDRYSESKLQEFGINSIFTGCPTMWSLPATLTSHGSEDEVVTTVTCHGPNHLDDEAMLRILGDKFKRVLVWPQGAGDREYLNRLKLPKNCVILENGLEVFNEALDGRIYVGTRLHAGIRASQRGRPSLVISIDNRATEIGRDTNFPVLERSQVGQLLPEYLDNMRTGVQINLPHEAIRNFVSLVRTAIEENS